MGRSSKGNKLSKSAPRSLLLGESGVGLQAQGSVGKPLKLEKILKSLKNIQKDTAINLTLSINTPPGSLKEKGVEGEGLFGINFSGYDFSLSELKNVIFGHKDQALASKLANANFEAANLINVSFEGVDLKKANFKEAEVRLCEFKNADLSGANISGGTFFGSEFNDLGPGSLDCNFKGENIFNRTTFNQCLQPFSQEINLEGMSFLGAAINQTNFTPKQQLKNTIFFESKINSSSLQEADLERANLALSKLTDVDMRKSSLINADLSHVEARNVNFYQADFSGADLTYIKIKESVLADANFEGADLEGAIFTDCHFARVDLAKAKNRSKAKFINCTGMS
jgi:uncharacterized protein YjbI with pentapeptide repeats